MKVRRREFITLIGGAAATWPLVARAQQGGRMRRIGVLMAFTENDPQGAARVAAFQESLQKLGRVQGRNIQFDTRWAGANTETMKKFAKELVTLQPDLILSNSTPTTKALLQQTHTIPIIFAVVTDPIGSGFIKSFAQPGGNVTGLTNIESTMGGKWVELLKEIAPRITRVAMLFNPKTATYAEFFLNPFKSAAANLGVEPIIAPVQDKSELEPVFAAQARAANSGLAVMTDSFTSVHRAEITSLAAYYRLPAIYPFSFFVKLGGLLSYGNDPVQAPVKFELTINLKTAKALGLTVTPLLLSRANEVIE